MWGIPESQAGILYRYTGGDPSDLSNYLVIHAPGPGEVIQIETFLEYQDGQEYYGAYTAGDEGYLDHATRLSILETAKALTFQDIYWPTTDPGDVLTPKWNGSRWDGSITNILYMRCDGVVEYAYESNGVMVWGREDEPGYRDITESVDLVSYGPLCNCNLWDHNNLVLPVNEDGSELTPDVQRGAIAPGHTRMYPSDPEDPTRVIDLEALSHDDDGNPLEPRVDHIRIRWVDATDVQSDIWGYYISVDQYSMSIPTHTDYSVERVQVSAGDSRALPVRAGYIPEWTSPSLNPGSYYVHVRSVDNAGNWGDISGAHLCTAHLGPLVIEGGGVGYWTPYVPGATWTYLVHPEGVTFTLTVDVAVQIGAYQAYPLRNPDTGYSTYSLFEEGTGEIEVGIDGALISPEITGVCEYTPPVLLIPAEPEIGWIYPTSYQRECDGSGSPAGFQYEVIPVSYEDVTVQAGTFSYVLRMDTREKFEGSQEWDEELTHWAAEGIGVVKVQDKFDLSDYIELVWYAIPGRSSEKSTIPADFTAGRTEREKRAILRGLEMLKPSLRTRRQ
jgi:hypothetical protein